MELVLLPSSLAIGLKIAIFMRYHESLHRENFNLGVFFFAVFALNLVELIILSNDYNQQTNLLLLLTYYCSAVCIIHAYVNIAIHYSGFSWQLSRIKFVLNALLGLLITGLIMDRSIIAGVQVADFSLTKIAGPNYWLFQLYAVGGLLFALGLLIRGIRHISANISKQQCVILLLSTLLPVLVTFAIIGLQMAGVQITAVLFMSFALTLMLGVIVIAEEKSRLFRLLTFIPFTKERRLHKRLLAQVSGCISLNEDPAQENPLNLKQMMRDFEGLLIEHMLDYYDGNQKMTASALGVSEATVSRRARAVGQRRSTQIASSDSNSIRE